MKQKTIRAAKAIPHQLRELMNAVFAPRRPSAKGSIVYEDRYRTWKSTYRRSRRNTSPKPLASRRPARRRPARRRPPVVAAGSRSVRSSWSSSKATPRVYDPQSCVTNLSPPEASKAIHSAR